MVQDLWNSHNAQMKRARYHPEREGQPMTYEQLVEALKPATEAMKRLSDAIEVLKVRLAEIERRTGIHEPTGE